MYVCDTLQLPKSKSSSPLGHSAEVDILLHASGQTFSLSHTCSTALRLAKSAQVEPGPARVEIITDGRSNFANVVILGYESDDDRWLKIEMLRVNPAGLPE